MLPALPAAREMLADRGYDRSHFRAALLARGIVPCIPSTRCRKVERPYDKTLYRQRPRIENMFGRIKGGRRIATRYDCRASGDQGVAAAEIDPQPAPFRSLAETPHPEAGCSGVATTGATGRIAQGFGRPSNVTVKRHCSRAWREFSASRRRLSRASSRPTWWLESAHRLASCCRAAHGAGGQAHAKSSKALLASRTPRCAATGRKGTPASAERRDRCETGSPRGSDLGSSRGGH